jgi:hypothetical protein
MSGPELFYFLLTLIIKYVKKTIFGIAIIIGAFFSHNCLNIKYLKHIFSIRQNQ